VHGREKLGAGPPSQRGWLLDSWADQATIALVETAREPGHAEVASRPDAPEPVVTALNVPLVAIATALTVLVFAFGVRRLIGLPRSILRVLAAGLIAFFVAPPIIRAMGGGTGSPVLELPS
jgi:hypothetical protein